MAQIANDLVEAYVGYHENEYYSDYAAYVAEEIAQGHTEVQSQDSWTVSHAEKAIRASTPKERLEIYLTWNGIIGYTGRIWEISQGGFEN